MNKIQKILLAVIILLMIIGLLSALWFSTQGKLLIDFALHGTKESELCWLIESNYTDHAVKLIKSGCNVNEIRRNTFALYEAATAGNLRVAKLLLENGAKINLQNYHGRTALMGAAEYEHIEMLDYLLSHKADPNLRNQSRYTALMIAIQPDIVLEKTNLLSVVSVLLKHNADVNAKGDDGKTALFLVLERIPADPKIIRLLIDSGADPTVKIPNGESILSLARKNGNPEIIKMIKDAIAARQTSKPNF